MQEPPDRDRDELPGEPDAEPNTGSGGALPVGPGDSAIPPGGFLSTQSGHDGRFYWPAADRPPPEGERIETNCGACGQVWVSHLDLAGSRLSCHCGAWVTIPVPAGDPALEPPGHEEHGGGPPALVDDHGMMTLSNLKSGETFDAPVSTSTPLAPGTLRHASVDVQRRWTDRTWLEIVGILIAFMVPSACISVFLEGRAQALAMPLADLVTGALVIAIGFTAGVYTFGGLRASKAKFHMEGLMVGLGGAAIAVGYSWVLKKQGLVGEDFLLPLVSELGLLGAVFVIGFCPAVFEELAFRGLLQGRLMALYGEKQGILITGVAFALAHGVTTGFPFHVVGGLYLCWLRRRSGSLYPCMLTHFAYNTTLVIATSQGVG